MSAQAEPEKELESRALSLVDQARTIVITDHRGFGRAAEFLATAKAGEKAVEEYFADIVDKAHKTWKALVAKRDEAKRPWQEARGLFASAMDVYKAEEERERIRKERELQEAARKREEEERLAEAIHLEEQGATEEAAAVLEAPVVAPVVSLAAPKVDGLSSRVTYGAEVSDLWLLVQHVATHRECLNLLTVNGPALNAMARAQKDELRLPGVRLTKKNVFSSTSK
jgi:hypothetical protein